MAAQIKSRDPEHWRNRAEEARAIAVQMTDPHTKATMLAIAQDYERLAKWADESRGLCSPTATQHRIRLRDPVA